MRTLYAPGPVIKRRWWSCFAGRLGMTMVNADTVLAETRSKARYRYWLGMRDVWPDIPITDISVHANELAPVYERPIMQRPAMPPKERRTITHAEWLTEAERRFGKKAMDWRFVCPICGESQSMHEFVEAGQTVEEAQSHAYFSCIGRWVKGRGCDWTLGGLLQVHTLSVLDPEGKAHPVFEFADEEVKP